MELELLLDEVLLSQPGFFLVLFGDFSLTLANTAQPSATRVNLLLSVRRVSFLVFCFQF